MNKQYVDSNFYGTSTTLDQINAPVNTVSMNNNRITNLDTPVGSGDAATKGYIDSNFYANTTSLDSISTPTGSLSINN